MPLAKLIEVSLLLSSLLVDISKLLFVFFADAETS